MGFFKTRSEYHIADKAIRTVMKAIEENNLETLLRFIDLAEKATSDIYQPSTFETFREIIRDPDNYWIDMLQRGIRDIDHNVLYTNAINIMYWGASYGIHRKNEIEAKYGCNIPNIILFDPTAACNKHCIGCWSAEYGNQWNLSYEELTKIVSDGEEIGCHIYMLTGGEPLVRKDDLIKLAAKFPHSAFHVYTNGSLIDDDFCEQVREVGNITFALSLEGFEEMTDARRGKGSFKELTDAMLMLKRHKLGFAASVCYTSKNYKYVTSDEFLKMLIDLGAFHVWYFHYMPVGKDAAPELLLNKDQREYMIRRIRFLRQPNNKNLPIFVADFQNDGQFVGGCIAGGRNYIHINAKGDIEPCVFIHYSDANIRDMTILEAMQQPLFMKYKEDQPFNHNHFRPCPMLENSSMLADVVHSTDAVSTDYVAPESPEDLQGKTVPYDKQWLERATELWEEFGPEHPSGYPEKQEEYAAQQKKWQKEITQELEDMGIMEQIRSYNFARVKAGEYDKQ